MSQIKFMVRKEFLSTVKDPRTRAILIVPVISDLPRNLKAAEYFSGYEL